MVTDGVVQYHGPTFSGEVDSLARLSDLYCSNTTRMPGIFLRISTHEHSFILALE